MTGIKNWVKVFLLFLRNPHIIPKKGEMCHFGAQNQHLNFL